MKAFRSDNRMKNVQHAREAGWKTAAEDIGRPVIRVILLMLSAILAAALAVAALHADGSGKAPGMGGADRPGEAIRLKQVNEAAPGDIPAERPAAVRPQSAAPSVPPVRTQPAKPSAPPVRPKPAAPTAPPVRLQTVAPSIPSVRPSPDAESDARTPEDAAREWIAALSGHPGYEGWQHARVQLSALGPGRHGWLALVVAGRENRFAERGTGRDTASRLVIGHLVIAAKPEGGYVLTAFGPGEPPADLP